LHHKAKINSLPAVGKNVLLTTNERKSMSTKTNFKRLALGVIAALGFGMLSVAPSQAAISGTVTVTTTNGVAETDLSDSSTAYATLAIKMTADAATDSVTVKSYVSTKPTAAAAPTTLTHIVVDTATSTIEAGFRSNITGGVSTTNLALKHRLDAEDSTTVLIHPSGTTLGTVAGKIGIYFEGTTGLVVGTYTITSVVTPFSAGVAGTTQVVTNDIVVTAGEDESLVASQVYSTLGAISTSTALATVSATNAAKATLLVTLKNASDLTAARESVTATITGPGNIGIAGGSVGKSVVLPYTGAMTLSIYSDGTAGTSTITVKSTSVTFSTRTITFYSAAAASLTASANGPVIGVGSNESTILVVAKDSAGNDWAGTVRLYATSAASALIAGSETPGTSSTCTWTASLALHVCSVTGKLPGTASFKAIDAATVALATATSNEVSTRVSIGTATTAKLSFDKATYAPGEKAQVRVQVLDENGLAMPAKSISAGFTAAIASTKPFGAGSATFQDTITVANATSASSETNAGHMTYVVYMPTTSGAVTVSATGGTGLAIAGRVATSATATVVNNDPAVAAATAASEAATDAAAEAIDAANAATDAANLAAEAADAATVAAEEARDAADAATAAVEALATEVATLMAALKAQITTLANTVAKIAKKVKA
jgi:hypothetical protein